MLGRAVMVATMMSVAVPAFADPPHWAPAHGRREKEWRGDRDDWRRHDDRRARREWQRYDWNRPDPRYGYYEPSRYYVADGYRPYRLNANDRVYRGSDGRYYCRRKDGTTGLIIGGLAGGLLGNQVAPRGSRLLGTVAGGALGAILGKSLDDGVTCR